MTETEEERKAKEAEALFRIHGVDQRSSELTFTHPALADGAPIRLRQDGSDSNAFVPGTSTVIWPCAYTSAISSATPLPAWRSKPDAASPRIPSTPRAAPSPATPSSSSSARVSVSRGSSRPASARSVSPSRTPRRSPRVVT